MKNINLKVNGMSCGHCVMSIEGALNKLGVEKAKVHLKEGTVDVEFNESKFSLEDIKNEIEEVGYDVV